MRPQNVAPKEAAIRHGALGEVGATAVRELSDGLVRMTGCATSIAENAAIGRREIVLDLGSNEGLSQSNGAALSEDSFQIARNGESSLSIRAGSERGLVHAAADLLARLGAEFPPGAPARFPRIEVEKIAKIEPYAVIPSFSRRGFVSDIMTWNYGFADRLELHLRHDREFIPWMARRGINTFSYIRHAHDTRLRIDEIAPMLGAHGIGVEYGGHVLQILLPREKFESDPELFPADDDGKRLPRGNLCVSNRAAIDIVREGALRYVADYPENQLLHVWGADVKRGAWCRCGSCRELAPQHQYMEVVNTIAESLARSGDSRAVAYLAYHDTIDPYPGLRPLPNVRVEWAPRERCYSHAIDNRQCEINSRYFDSLKRYVEIFEGRCDIFEYYADAILFGGLAFASPAIIARDMRAYRALGIDSISCLTFGAYSLLAYPTNLETFVRCTRDVNSDSDEALRATARGRHPRCAVEMSDAYRAIADASRLVLDYADVMSLRMEPSKARRKRSEIAQASALLRRALSATDAVKGSIALLKAERQLWTYSAEVLEGIVDYLDVKLGIESDRATRGEAAVRKITDAIEHVRAIDLEIRGTWGAYDLEWMREVWIARLRRGLETGS